MGDLNEPLDCGWTDANAPGRNPVERLLFAHSLAGSAPPALAHAGGAKPVKEPRLTDPSVPTTPAPSTTPAPTPTAATTALPEIVFTAEQQAVIDRRIAAARRNAEEEAKKAITDAATAAEAQAAEAARLKAEEDKGAYDAAKAIIEQERDEWKGKFEAHDARIAAMLTMLSPGVEKRWTDLPESVSKLYEGEPEDVLAKAAFLDRTEDLAKALTTTPAQRVGITPRPNGPTVPEKVTSPVTAKQITG